MIARGPALTFSAVMLVYYTLIAAKKENHQEQIVNRESESEESSPQTEKPASTPGVQPRANPWPFVVPFIAFMLIATQYPKFEPVQIERSIQGATTEQTTDQSEIQNADGVVVQPNPVAARKYMILVGLQVLVGLALMGFWFRTYRAHFPIRFSRLAVGVGVLGIFVWIGLTSLDIEQRLMALVGFPSEVVARAAFRPYFEIQSTGQLVLFLFLRFTLLSMIVPMLEELFLRGWLVRWVEDADGWHKVSLTKLAFGAIATATVYGVLTHPSEAIAAAVWFSLVTWLMLRRGNVWDCVLAHGVTNFLLGVYVMWFEEWHLW